jgi:hypothetical protein
MQTTKTTTTRFSCSDCSLSFNSQRELQLHEDELHGELRRHLQAGCGYSGPTSAGQPETQAMEEQAKNGMDTIALSVFSSY